MLAIRFFIHVRGLKWQERTEKEISTDVLRKQDLLLAGGMALVGIDTVTGSYLQALHMLGALRSGEAFRLSLTFSLAAMYECMGGVARVRTRT